jgi:hypothetical protein
VPASFDNIAFFTRLKHESEQHWQSVSIDSIRYGFQFQPGTRWLPPLSDREIRQFETELGFAFPRIYRDFLRCMNGTDLPTINVYGSSGTPTAYGVGYYAFPRDLTLVKETIQWIYDAFEIDEAYVRVHRIPHIVPVVSHRFLVTDPCPGHPVLSMHGTDVIVYARDLPTFLVNDIPHHHAFDSGVSGNQFAVPFWLAPNESGA